MDVYMKIVKCPSVSITQDKQPIINLNKKQNRSRITFSYGLALNSNL